MLFACWSVKGGSGTTVVAASLALLLSSSAPRGAVLLDTAGDLAPALGVEAGAAAGLGLADWLAEPSADAAALARLEVDVGSGVRLVPWSGSGNGAGGGVPEAATGAVDRLLLALAGEKRLVVADCGSSVSAGTPVGLALASVATLSLLVMRPCFLALRRAVAAPLRPSGVILVDEPGRTLNREDIEDALGVPVRAEVPWSEGIARAVDAGLLAGRLPRPLQRSLKEAA